MTPGPKLTTGPQWGGPPQRIPVVSFGPGVICGADPVLKNPNLGVATMGDFGGSERSIPGFHPSAACTMLTMFGSILHDEKVCWGPQQVAKDTWLSKLPLPARTMACTVQQVQRLYLMHPQTTKRHAPVALAMAFIRGPS